MQEIATDSNGLLRSVLVSAECIEIITLKKAISGFVEFLDATVFTCIVLSKVKIFNFFFLIKKFSFLWFLKD